MKYYILCSKKIKTWIGSIEYKSIDSSCIWRGRNNELGKSIKEILNLSFFNLEKILTKYENISIFIYF